ncbi:sugar ABC transporter substrate-binding protein [Microlunatus parietis]|uniref:Arabinogalactan oligomer/maltooligosaccharide transport system substrate-binding protein n=1 Tax=Microlunatus parietis TaxID=682979 RepID=A0A7Y9I7T7_9ACTN|nr:maltose ABC transporter substrate-binding protein [Microlunatus parietis]NYE71825.1 arabinogalactan oligomer/maltooligosaccharide transport system substrate-binding protein [Microlunatus parietis]
MKRRSFVGLALAAPLAACSTGTPTGTVSSPAPSSAPSTPAAQSAKLVVWVDGSRAPAVKEIGKQFSTDNPGVTIEVVTKNFADIGPQFSTQVPSGKGPDIAVTPHDGIGNFIKSGVVAPIELGDLANRLTPLAVSAFSQDGQCYGLPYSIENIGLVRNNALSKDVPQTWEDLITAGKEAGKKYPLLLGVGEGGDPYHTFPLQSSFGNTVFRMNDDGTFSDTLTIGDETGLKFATWLGSQGKKGNKVLDTSLTGDIAKEQFLNQNSPFFITGPWNTPDFEKKKLDVTVMPIPSAGGQPARPFVGVQGFILSARSKNALLATEFLVNYLGTKEVQLKLFEQGDRVPALTEAAEDATVTGNPLVQGYAEAGQDGLPMPSIPPMAQVWTFWGGAEAAIVGGAEPEQTWTTMAKNIEAAIKKAG